MPGKPELTYFVNWESNPLQGSITHTPLKISIGIFVIESLLYKKGNNNI